MSEKTEKTIASKSKTLDQLESCSVQMNHFYAYFPNDEEVNQGNHFNFQKTSTVTRENIEVSSSSDASPGSAVLIPDIVLSPILLKTQERRLCERTDSSLTISQEHMKEKVDVEEKNTSAAKAKG